MTLTSPARKRPRWLYAVTVPVIACCLLGLWSAGARAAAPVIGTLDFLPATGTAVDRITTLTVSSGSQKGCPSSAGAVIGRLNGPAGSGWNDLIAVSTTTAGVSSTDEMTFPLTDTFAGIAASNSLTIVPGRYVITITCLTSVLGGQLGDFVGSIDFTDANHYRSVPSGGGPAPTTTPATTTPGTTTPAPTTPAPTTTTPGTTTPAPTTTTPVPTNTGPGLPSFGTLSFLPPQGADVDPVTAQTHSSSASSPGCPTNATFVEGMIFGPGGWADGVGGLSRTSAAALSAVGADFLGALSDTFKGLAASNGLAIIPGRYDVVLTCSTGSFGQTPLGTFSGAIFFTDATHYQTSDPNAAGTDTTTTIAASPDDRADLGQEVALTAQLAPASAVGTVQFTETIGENVVNVGAPVAVVGGKAVLTRSTHSFGLHLFSAAFVPTDAQKFKASASDDLVYVVAKPVPPLPPARATLSGRASVGRTLTCSAAFANATSTSASWLRDGGTISGAAGRTYRVVAADKGHQLACRIDATNAGGTTHRISAYVRVTG